MQGIAPKINVLLEQMVNGNVADSMFKQLMAKYEAQQNDFTSSLCELKAEQSVVKMIPRT